MPGSNKADVASRHSSSLASGRDAIGQFPTMLMIDRLITAALRVSVEPAR